MNVQMRHISISLVLIMISSSSYASASEYEIDDINLNEENFLDRKAHSDRKSLVYEWYDYTSGWRMNGASLDGDLTFLQTELKLQHEL